MLDHHDIFRENLLIFLVSNFIVSLCKVIYVEGQCIELVQV